MKTKAIKIIFSIYFLLTSLLTHAQQEVGYIESKCREYNIPKPVSFAYPGNQDDASSQVLPDLIGTLPLPLVG